MSLQHVVEQSPPFMIFENLLWQAMEEIKNEDKRLPIFCAPIAV
jgi:hypothetical protein